MRIWSSLVLAVGLFSAVSLAQKSVAATPACLLTLEWQSSADPTVVGYAVYYGVTGEPITNRLDVGAATSVILTNLTASASYSFFVVAYDENLDESEPSNFLDYIAQAISAVKLSALPDGAMSLSFQVAPGATCYVEWTDTLTPPNWQFLSVATGNSNGMVTIVDTVAAVCGMRFYRAVVP